MIYDAIVVENGIDRCWVRRLQVIGNAEEKVAAYCGHIPNELRPGRVKIIRQKTGTWTLEASWPVRGRFDLTTCVGVWPMVGWWVGDGLVSRAIKDGALAFALAFGVDPTFAFIRQIPPRAVEFVEVCGATLIMADWVPDGFVALACGGMQQRVNGGWRWKIS